VGSGALKKQIATLKLLSSAGWERCGTVTLRDGVPKNPDAMPPARTAAAPRTSPLDVGVEQNDADYVPNSVAGQIRRHRRPVRVLNCAARRKMAVRFASARKHAKPPVFASIQ